MPKLRNSISIVGFPCFACLVSSLPPDQSSFLYLLQAPSLNFPFLPFDLLVHRLTRVFDTRSTCPTSLSKQLSSKKRLPLGPTFAIRRRRHSSPTAHQPGPVQVVHITSTMMEVQQPQSIDWANDAYAAFSAASKHQNKWTAFDSSSMPMDSNTAFTVPPALLTNSSARYGQITPPEERSPAESAGNVREGSIPVEELMNESLWPANGQQYLQSPPEDSSPPPKRRRTTRRSTSQPQVPAVTQLDDGASADPQPPQRKRGRPKSQPQMVEAYTADGFPFQVSSARQSHLEKNRVAAHKCRQRKKEYIGSLEGRAREFSAKNKALKENVSLLREEVLSLKNEVLRHAGCGFWAVDEYLARCAGDLLGREAPASTRVQPVQYDTPPNMHQMRPRQDSNDSMPSLGSMSSSPDADDFGGLELLRDFDDDQSFQ